MSYVADIKVLSNVVYDVTEFTFGRVAIVHCHTKISFFVLGISVLNVSSKYICYSNKSCSGFSIFKENWTKLNKNAMYNVFNKIVKWTWYVEFFNRSGKMNIFVLL
jgi:hypothetical protein